VDFFDAQDRARRASRWLIVVYAVATALIVAGVTLIVGFVLASYSDGTYPVDGVLDQHTPLLIATAVLTALFIFGASAFKTASLSAGGGKVASSMGGTLVPTDVSEPLRRRLRNIVEEVSIASGVPVPEIYVLEKESGINAFAAGFAPGSAAIAVTRGALELLDRDELQGVIAHEFSHVLNGDMRLNIRMMGVLFGIMILGLAGRMILRGGYHTRLASSSRDRGTPVIMIIGLGLAILGGIGVLFSRIIKASVSRQREYLADASAVQFTRQTRGIAGALKKIGGLDAHSYIKAADPEEVSHMLFGAGSKLSGLFATHPPLAKRIKAIEPSFDERDYPSLSAGDRDAVLVGAAQDVGTAAAFAAPGSAVTPAEIAESVGRPEDRHYDYASALREAIPGSLYDAAHNSNLAWLLALALVIEPAAPAYPRQLARLTERIGVERARVTRRFADDIAQTGAAFRLPLLEVCFPTLRRRPAGELQFLIELAKDMIEIDAEVDLFEYCFYRILISNLGDSAAPGRRGRSSRQATRDASLSLLGLIADHGHADRAERDAALAAGIAQLGEWAAGRTVEPRQEKSVTILDASLDALTALDNDARRQLVRAISEVAAYDGTVNVTEAELVRVVCATLDCPLPPIVSAAALDRLA
jgi:Zn-dependent protease with chaperone function